MKKPPGPNIFRGLSNVIHFALDPISLMKKMQKQYGDFIQIWMGPLRFFFVYHPRHIQHILQTKQKNYLHSRLIFDKLIPLTGSKGLVQLEGEKWKKHRQITNVSFKPQQMESFVPLIVEITRKSIDKLTAQKKFEMCDEMTDLVLKTAMRMLFSLEAEEQVSKITTAFLEANRCCGKRIKSIVHLPTPIPSPNNLRFKRAVKKLDEFAYSMIKERRKQQDFDNDMLGTLMEKGKEDEQQMDDVQLRDHMMTFLFAGHETTACSLTWCFYLISQHSEIERKMREEIDSVLGERDPEYTDLPKLKYIAMVYQEALRLYPPAWILARQPIDKDEIDGKNIPKNCNILLNIWEVHRHPDFWDDPNTFDPERFSSENSKKQHRFAFLPFGAGPRICSGARLSMVEGVIILAMFLRNHKCTTVPGQKIEVETTITARPRYGIMMEIDKNE
ncbi:cytochrome P450 [Candidatus Uabimicrobium sp. HlEnr_7]|uniref:cytochrome P450 n=1 Tax=Candidatus Uabimicrobium helgolandensis TaxID=3095367 RepID=UPI003557A12F